VRPSNSVDPRFVVDNTDRSGADAHCPSPRLASNTTDSRRDNTVT
jgi:hypothetical protein